VSEYDLSGYGCPDYGNPLSPEESLDQDEFGEDIADGYSPSERPWGVSPWGVTSCKESRREGLGRRLAREQREVTDEPEGDGIGDSIGTGGELIDDQVGDRRAGRLVSGAIANSPLATARSASRLSKSERLGVYRPPPLGKPLDDKHVRVGHEVVDEPRVDAASRMQRDPVLLVHVVARGDLRVSFTQ
jgi:hypothetical protein